MTTADSHDDVIWVQVDSARCLAVSRSQPRDEQLRTIERITHALEALAQHGSTSAEESLVGVRLGEVAALRRDGVEVITADRFLAWLAPPQP